MSYRLVKLPSDEPVQYVGVYVFNWRKVIDGEMFEPTVGFVEEE